MNDIVDRTSRHDLAHRRLGDVANHHLRLRDSKQELRQVPNAVLQHELDVDEILVARERALLLENVLVLGRWAGINGAIPELLALRDRDDPLLEPLQTQRVPVQARSDGARVAAEAKHRGLFVGRHLEDADDGVRRDEAERDDDIEETL